MAGRGRPLEQPPMFVDDDLLCFAVTEHPLEDREVSVSHPLSSWPLTTILEAPVIALDIPVAHGVQTRADDLSEYRGFGAFGHSLCFLSPNAVEPENGIPLQLPLPSKQVLAIEGSQIESMQAKAVGGSRRALRQCVHRTAEVDHFTGGSGSRFHRW